LASAASTITEIATRLTTTITTAATHTGKQDCERCAAPPGRGAPQ
jgi:hypothetical protein